MSKKEKKAKGGSFISALCKILGIIIILAVIAVSLFLTIPKLMGYEIYNVETGSMSPAIPVGSVIFVEKVEPTEVKEGDIITFRNEGVMVTHRVTANNKLEGQFVTKGDANEIEDMEPVPYSLLMGKVVKYFPVFGKLLVVYNSMLGKVYILGIAACGVLLLILGSMLGKNS